MLDVDEQTARIGRGADAGDLAGFRSGQEAPYLTAGDIGDEHLIVTEPLVVATIRDAA